MTNELQIVVSCTSTKSLEAPKYLRLRNYPHYREPEERAEAWLARLALARESTTLSWRRAYELYAGTAWTLSRELEAMAFRSGFNAALWVVSAGYGLVKATDRLNPYAATFQPGHADEVSPPAQSSRWWDALCLWSSPPTPTAPRSLSSLVGVKGPSGVLVVLGSSYLKAVGEDLRRVPATAQDRVTVVSAGTRDLGWLTGNLLPLRSQMRPAFGGGALTLNLKAAIAVVKGMRGGGSWSHGRAAHVFDKLTATP